MRLILLWLLTEEGVNVILGGAVPALVKHLRAPPCGEAKPASKPFKHEVEKLCAFALGLLAMKVVFGKLQKLFLYMFVVHG